VAAGAACTASNPARAELTLCWRPTWSIFFRLGDEFAFHRRLTPEKRRHKFWPHWRSRLHRAHMRKTVGDLAVKPMVSIPAKPAVKNRSMRPVSIRINLLAGYASKFWFAIVALACTPYYVRVLGADGYGLVGFFLTLQRLAALLDVGLSTTINREMAHFTDQPQEATHIRDMLRTLEIVYWGISLSIFAIIAMASGWISREWIKSASCTPGEMQTLILIMGFAIAAQLPQSFYSAALAGQERHVVLNLIRMAWQGTRFIGAVFILLFISSTPFAFFSWQLATGVLVTAMTAIAIWSSQPRQQVAPRFRRYLLRDVLGFTAGAGMFTVTAVLISQMDKVILSKQLSSEYFGYYMLAYSIPSMLFLATSPISAVMFPRLSRHVAQKDEVGLKRSYHLGSQLTSLIVVPTAITGAFFSSEIIDVWLGDPQISKQCSLVTTILFCGIGINCLSSMPHTLQLSCGWTRLANLLNLLSIAILGPFLLWACARYGAVGASFTWMIYSSLYLIFQVQLMHRRLLPKEKKRWILDLLIPVALCIVAGSLTRHLLHPQDRLDVLASVTVAWVTCAALVGVSSPLLRKMAVSLWKEQKTRLPPAKQNA